MKLAPGVMFGRYRIEDLLGEGGMGSVYRATDTKLERAVALKLLRREAARQYGEGGAARLVREARAAAKLDHPGSVAVYDVGDIDGTPYIAMELVPGRALRAYVGDAEVARSTRIRWLTDIARALAVAHAAGLVHRDVKPENVMVRDDGAIKVLDFGIASVQGAAKPAGPPDHWSEDDAEPWISSFSRDGSIVGTPRYMSPEQLFDQTVDGRSDQFAWGVTAYELLAGKAPWLTGALTYGSLLDLTKHTAKPLRSVAPDVSPELAAIVHRAMEKDPERRFPSMDDVVTALASLNGTTGAPRPPRQRLRTTVVLGVTVAAAVLATLVLRHPTKSSEVAAAARSATPFVFHPQHARRLTIGEGCEEFPSFTPDGAHVVFDATTGATTAIFVLTLADGTTRALTRPRAWDYAADVSPDGRQVAFLRSEDDGSVGTYVVDIEGRTEPRLVARGHVRPSFSPDGTAIWAGDPKEPARYDLATGAVTRRFGTPVGALVPYGRELADGRFVAVFPEGNGGVLSGIAEVDDGGVRWLLHDKVVEVLAPTPRGDALISARRTPANNLELFAFDLDGGAQVLASADVLPEEGMRFDREGRAVVWSNCREASAVLRVDAHDALAPIHAPAAWNETAVTRVPGTQSLAVVSSRMGPTSVWVLGADGKYTSRELDARAIVEPTAVAVSPDASVAALQLGAGLVLAPLDGSKNRRLTDDPHDAAPAFSRDGKAVWFTRESKDGGNRVFAVDLAGGQVRALLEPATRDAVPSPQGDRLVYLAGEDRNALVPMFRASEGGAAAPLAPALAPASYHALALSPDGKRVAVLMGGNVLIEIDVATHGVRRRISGGARQLGSPTYVDDELLVVGTQWIGDVWIADGPF